jgi:4-oxalocrotonate tautomerase
MPLVQIKGIEGHLGLEQKQELIRRVTETVVAVEGERARPVPG